jgi:hypothetical protein
LRCRWDRACKIARPVGGPEPSPNRPSALAHEVVFAPFRLEDRGFTSLASRVAESINEFACVIRTSFFSRSRVLASMARSASARRVFKSISAPSVLLRRHHEATFRQAAEGLSQVPLLSRRPAACRGALLPPSCKGDLGEASRALKVRLGRFYLALVYRWGSRSRIWGLLSLFLSVSLLIQGADAGAAKIWSELVSSRALAAFRLSFGTAFLARSATRFSASFWHGFWSDTDCRETAHGPPLRSPDGPASAGRARPGNGRSGRFVSAHHAGRGLSPLAVQNRNLSHLTGLISTTLELD